MPRKPRQTRRHIIDAAYDLFYRQGYAQTSIDAVAEAAGVTKRTLYYHFDSKQTLVAAVLEMQHEMALARIERWAQGVSDKPSRMVRRLFTELAAWSKKAGWRGSGFTRAAMEFAASPGHPARRAARRHKASVEAWLAEQFARHGISTAEGLSRQVMLLVEGCNSLILIHGDGSYADAASDAASLLVEAATARGGQE